LTAAGSVENRQSRTACRKRVMYIVLFKKGTNYFWPL